MTMNQKLRRYVGVAYAGAKKTVDVARKGATAVLAVQTGLGIRGVEGSSSPGAGTELQVHRVDGNTTAMHPYAEKGQARQEHAFNPDNVTPEVLEHFKKLGVKDPEQFIRNVQTARKQLAEMPWKKSSETNHKKFDEETEHLTSDEKIATVRAAAEEASKIADRVTQVLAARQLLSEQKSIAEAPQGNSAEAPQKSIAEAPQKSNETEQKDAGILCLDGSATKVGYTLTEESLTIIADLSTVNTCDNTISNVYFKQNAQITCPADCTPQAIDGWLLPGTPSSIGFAGTSTAGNIDAVSCTTSDGNNVAPTKVILEVQPIGTSNGQLSLGTQKEYELP
jgi:hypothetical protein